MRSHLQQALRALEEDRPRHALEALLEGWRIKPHAGTADTIDRLSHALCRALPPLAETSTPEYHRRWLDLSLFERSVDVPRLLHGLHRPPLGQLLAQRVDRILALPPDPRIASGLVRMIDQPPATAQSLYPMWTRIFSSLRSLADVRGRPLLEHRLAQPKPEPRFWSMLYSRTRNLLKMLPEQDEMLLPEEQSLLSRIEDLLQQLEAASPMAEELLLDTSDVSLTPFRDALIHEIAAAPSDDGPRLVLSDQLTERGDPRGELIALQIRERTTPLNSAQSQRKERLLKQHSRSWLSPLDDVVSLESAVFQRGFLTRCEAHFERETQRSALIGHPLWSTVERLVTDEASLICHPTLKALRSVGGLDIASFTTLCRGDRPLPIAEVNPLELGEALRPRGWEAICSTTAFPELTHLGLTATQLTEPARVGELRWLTQGTLGRQLSTLELTLDEAEIEHDPFEGWLSFFHDFHALRRLTIQLLGHPTAHETRPYWRVQLDAREGQAPPALLLETLWPDELLWLEFQTAEDELLARYNAFIRHLFDGLGPESLERIHCRYIGTLHADRARQRLPELLVALPESLRGLVDSRW